MNTDVALGAWIDVGTVARAVQHNKQITSSDNRNNNSVKLQIAINCLGAIAGCGTRPQQKEFPWSKANELGIDSIAARLTTKFAHPGPFIHTSIHRRVAMNFRGTWVTKSAQLKYHPKGI